MEFIILNDLKKIGFIVQARTGSTRLPKKILRVFYRKQTLIEVIINDLCEWIPKNNIIIATTDNPEDKIIEDIFTNIGLKVYKGSEFNVLDRFINAGLILNKEMVVRICADNPFIQKNFALDLIKDSILYPDYDYFSYIVNGVPAIKTHYGFWIEIIKFNTLKKLPSLTNDNYYIEHVSNYIYENPNNFKIKWKDVSKKLEGISDIRLTIDVEDDFIIASEIYNFYRKNKSFEYLKYLLKNDFYQYVFKMKKNKINNLK